MMSVENIVLVQRAVITVTDSGASRCTDRSAALTLSDDSNGRRYMAVELTWMAC